MRTVCLLATLALPTQLSAASFKPYKKCIEDSDRQTKRSAELQKIEKADQDDRIDWEKIYSNPKRSAELQRRDEARRRRVGEIFGEGCFKNAEDYAAAALVYQHGNTPDQYYQAYLWFKRAFELGDLAQERMIPMAIDRYLVTIGHKQLFATQSSLDGPDSKCWCLEQVEGKFPDSERSDSNKLDKALARLKELNAKNPSCPSQQCQMKPLKDTPQGIFPGVW